MKLSQLFVVGVVSKRSINPVTTRNFVASHSHNVALSNCETLPCFPDVLGMDPEAADLMYL